jgi:hypothetical protein
MKQFADRHQRVARRNGPFAMHSLVAEPGDDPRLAEDHLPDQRLEGRLVDQRAQVVLVGELQGGIVLVKPRHRQLH